jgi:ArsR family transcriptional regulator
LSPDKKFGIFLGGRKILDILIVCCYIYICKYTYFKSGVKMRDLVKVLKAISDPMRIRIVKLLERKKMCVCELTEVLNIGQPSVSHHLRILKDAGLVVDLRNGLWIDYELSEEKYNKYAPQLLELISSWLTDDPKILDDKKSAKKVNRVSICKR